MKRKNPVILEHDSGALCIIELKIKAISERERSRHLHPQCDTRNRATFTCKLFTFAGVNRTCGSFLSPEAR